MNFIGLFAALAVQSAVSPTGVFVPTVCVGDAGRAIAVEPMRCSAMPVNIRWPGHQRELDQTEICHFARFDFRGETQVRVTVPKGTHEVIVRPAARKVAVRREGSAAVFTLKTPGAYSVEFDGRHRNLMVFADPPHDWADIDRTAANVRWFGPGEHEAGVIRPKAGETIFLDEGAVVYGRIEARDADGLRICGRGVLDASRVKEVPVEVDPKLVEEQRKKGWAITNVKRFDAIRLMFCDDARIEGVTVRDSQIYAIRPVCCDRLTVDNVKILGSWRYNSDGIDMHNCRQVRIRDSFIRTYDDSICVKGFDYILPESEMLHEGVLHDVFEDVLVERCMIWNDWGRALEIGAETRAKEIRDITFRDCDVLAVHSVALDVQNCDRAHVHDVVFENIRVEYDSDAPKTVYSASAKDFDPASRSGLPPLAGVVIHYIPEYSKAGAENRGRVSSVAFRDIDVFAPSLPPGFCRGFDADHRVTGVTFSNIRLNGKDMTDDFRAKIVTNAFVDLTAGASSSSSVCAEDRRPLPDFNVRDYGGSVPKAAEAAAKAGGGRIVVPAGVWESGTIRLGDRCELHLEKGAAILGSKNPADYNANDAFPENFWSDGEEWSGGHLVLAYKAKDVAITGEGTIDGNGPAFFGEPDEDSRFPWYKYGLKLHPTDGTWYRPGPMVAMFLSKNIRLEGVTLKNAPCWTTHFRCCEDLEVTGVTIDADRTIANSDGFSIDCTRNVRVSGCRVKTGDDGFAIRASCRHHATTNACENVVIEDCDVWSCCLGIRYGVGTGLIRNVEVRNCRFHEAAETFAFSPAWSRTKKGVDFENIRHFDCTGDQCERPVCYWPAKADTHLKDVLFENCRFASLLPSAMSGDDRGVYSNIVFRNCVRTPLDRIRVRHNEDWHRAHPDSSRAFAELRGGLEKAVTFENCKPTAGIGEVRTNETFVSFGDRLAKVVVYRLSDRTDEHNELVQKDEWLVGFNERKTDVCAPIVAVEDPLTGRGTVCLRLAPLPHARANTNQTDFTFCGSRNERRRGLTIHATDYPYVLLPYANGPVGRTCALQDYQRRVRPYVPGRDGLFLCNTWGDRNRDTRINEEFLLDEVRAASELGVEVLQVDDGWQTGKSANSAYAKGVWNGYWAASPDFWVPDPKRFPHGLAAVTRAAAGKGVRFGLWYGPDSTDDAANWERDADWILKLHRECGVDFFKLDSMKTTGALSLARQEKLFDKLLKESDGKIVVDMDVTAEKRPGYFGMMKAGPLFVENRYTDWKTYWPHLTLRALWSLAEVIDPIRLRMEVLNPLRNADKYGDDPLAPAAYPVETLFAIVMPASSLGWFEVQNLAPETVAAWKPLVAKWKAERDAMAACNVIPIGARPDGVSWTGFVFAPRKAGMPGYALLFRELNENAKFDLGNVIPAVKQVEVLAGEGSATPKFATVNHKLGFVWLKYISTPASAQASDCGTADSRRGVDLTCRF